MIRVALANDNVGMRTAIRCLLEHSSEIVVVGEAENGKAAVQMAQDLKPDVLVLDADMPGMTGREVMQQLNYSHSAVQILVLSAYADYHQARDMTIASAAKYIEKKDASQLLIDGVHELAKGKSLQLSY